ncbi:zinc ribbon domain-containing protein [Trichloromonas sp.]|uniref:zinc ribbon domain-containing protein n=1 Tax=Trichloromonas sp. TaxID=3069249 RepID=UPI002A3DC013|nr:hypothetical protein [Trichloromonas sp.]
MSDPVQPEEQSEKKVDDKSIPPLQTEKVISDLRDIFSAATLKWKDQIASLSVVTLVLILVCWIPFANIAFLAGYLRTLLKTLRGEKAAVGDLFSAWDCFAQILVYVIIVLVAVLALGYLPIIGTIAGILISIVVSPGLYAVVDKQMGAIDAFKWSFETVKRDMYTWALVVVLGSILSSIGAAVFGIGLILTIPWGNLAIALLYERNKNFLLAEKV